MKTTITKEYSKNFQKFNITVEDIAKALNVQAFELFLPDPNILSDITIAGNMAEDIKRVLKRYDSYLQSGRI